MDHDVFVTWAERKAFRCLVSVGLRGLREDSFKMHKKNLKKLWDQNCHFYLEQCTMC